MKQVSTTKNSLILSSPFHHSIRQRSSFSKYRFLILLTCIAMIVCSCKKEDHNNKKTVPLKGEFVATGRIVIVPGSPGVLEQVRITDKGSGTPFGKATVEDNIKVDLTAAPEIIKGVETITAEDGDQIFSTSSGYSPAADANGNYQVFNTNTIIGGSGMFTGATGTYKQTVTGNIKVATPPTIVYDGRITY